MLVDVNAPMHRDVHHIESDHHGNIHFHQLCRQKKVAFQIRGIQKIDHQIGITRQKIVEGRSFIFTVRKKGIDPRQINDSNGVVV